MTSFEPIKFGFVLLKDFQIPEGVSVYEYKNHAAVDGTRSFLRLNLYLTMDKTYVTIWFGLLDPILTEAKLEPAPGPKDCDFSTCGDLFSRYDDILFRGCIDSEADAVCILRALRVGESNRYAVPQVLSKGPDGSVRCELMTPDDAIPTSG